VSAGAAVVGVETAGLGLLARFGAAGLTSGTLTAGTEVGGNALLRQPTDRGSVITDSLLNGFGAGILTFLPGVPGALPQSMRSALSVFSKAHAARSGAEAFFGTSLQIFGSTGYQFMTGGTAATSKSSGGSSVSAPGLLPRSQNPVGQSGGKPVFCWGVCK
jgi:hypothetical protein